MRPLVMKGHERPLTQLKYNREGDILLSAGRDTNISVWYSENGERLGTLDGHLGSVFTVDIDDESRVVISGAADVTVRFWDMKTGTELHKYEFKSTPRFLELSPDEKKLLVVSSEQMGQIGTIFIFDVDLSDLNNIKMEQVAQYERGQHAKFVQATWSYDGKHIFAGHEDGSVSKINAATGEFENHKKLHETLVTDIQMSPDRTYFVTSSRDKKSHLVFADTLEVQKTYSGDVPLNSAAVTPVKEYVIAGGGIDARDVTTSSDGKFEYHFFHKLFEDDLGRLGGHFGPINTIVVHPYGTSFASGGEDGYVRVHHFDPSYFEFDYGKTK